MQEYTAEDARRDANARDLARLCQILWDVCCEADPALRHHPVGRARKAA
jgi:hypothetical protein